MPILGVRGAPRECHLLFSGSTVDADLQIVEDVAATATFTLRGQVLKGGSLPEELEGIELRVIGADGVERRGLTDQLGCFRFSQLAEGIYSLQIVLDSHDILLESVAVGS
jgi:hypothetical protein